MKVGVEHSQKIKEKSLEKQMSFAEVAFAYVAEDLLSRIYTSEFKECMWLLGGYHRLTEETIKKQQRLEFYYVESQKMLPLNRLLPGQVLSIELQKEMFRAWDILGDYEISFSYELIAQKEDIFDWQVIASVSDMEIPVSMRIRRLQGKNQGPSKQSLSFLMEEEKMIEILAYAPEDKLSVSLWEIMGKLELIGDMEHYARVNEILRNESVSGRHIMEELSRFAGKEPKILREKRMEQIASYKTYGYMRKRWQQYQKRSAGKYDGMEEDWETVVDRLCNFMAPLWKALCKEEVFFDDWMPALGRFLG